MVCPGLYDNLSQNLVTQKLPFYYARRFCGSGIEMGYSGDGLSLSPT